MLSTIIDYVQARLCKFVAQSSGMVSSGSGMPRADDGPIPVLLGGLLGALGGILAGFVVSKILRYVAFLTGRHLGGYSWVLYGALLGAVVCGWLAATREDE